MSEPGKWAVVLGTSEGSGAAIAQTVAAQAGLNVFGVHRGNHPAGADAVEEAVRATGRRIHMRVADAGNADGAEAGADELLSVAGAGGVKLFVHAIANASIGSLAGDKEGRMRPSQLARTMDSMAGSFIYWAQAMLDRGLLAPQAQLLGLTNPIPESLVDGFAAISASKRALEVYVRHLAFELGPLGHRVNLLMFGLVDTRAVRYAFPGERWAGVEARVSSVSPQGRLATVEEVAAFVPLLLRPEARGFNGATIDFTGGEHQAVMDPLFNPRAWCRDEHDDES